ncbi:hypothetical protein [Sphingomonas sp. Y38-1Y]|uniref:hypothetical protein n=1 Tax=Sphingomonas sp. Y38-1Y TaxID=3078265 RepID=UPI0028E8192C|nr:hypothetical protein [Sphingomonas sp. Y38-1Y]
MSGAGQRDAVLRRRGALILAAIWCATLVLPSWSQTFDRSQGPVTMFGFQILSSGWIAIVYGQLAWLANLALPVALVALTSWSIGDRVAQWAAIVILVSVATMIDLVLRPAFHGNPVLLAGGWLWLAASLGTAIFTIAMTAVARQRGSTAMWSGPVA